MTIPRRKYIEAMALLEREGWAHGAGDRPGAYCATTAMWMVTERIEDLCFESLLSSPFCSLVPVWNFNDAPETTYEDVLTLLAFGHAGAFE